MAERLTPEQVTEALRRMIDLGLIDTSLDGPGISIEDLAVELGVDLDG